MPMSRKILFLIFLSFTFFSQAQDIRLRGNVSDSSHTNGLPNVLLMAIKFNDSTLVNYTRTDRDGIFKPVKIPVDTYIVILSHPSFSDKTYLLVPSKTDTVFNFKNVVLPVPDKPKKIAVSPSLPMFAEQCITLMALTTAFRT